MVEASESQDLAAILLNASYSPATLASYKSWWERIVSFLESIGQSAELPLDSRDIEKFMLHCYYAKNIKSSTIRTGLCAIGFFHKIRNLGDPTKNFRITRILMGMKKVPSKKQSSLPIGHHLLLRIISQINSLGRFNNIALKAILLLTYHGCLRIGEVVKTQAGHHIDLNCVRFLVKKGITKVEITLKSYKFSKEEATFIVPPDGGEFCPVRALENYLLLRGPLPGPLFCRQ